ncbi:MAG TPA: hypothetical protein VFC41_04325 [Anaerovoracaceae bacterium]|nr:hypothetical protein [Anaerovoracaceae bacterium]
MPGQRVPVMADSSVLAGIPLPCKALMEKRLFFSAAAKTVLEMEASKYQIIISDVEVFSFPNTTTAQENRQLLADTLFNSLKNSGYEIRSSNDDPAYTWLSTNNRKIIMYFMVNKKETSLYFGKADKLPPSFSTTSAIAEKSTMKSEGTKTWVNSDLSSNISSDNSNPPGLANLSAEGRQLTGKWGNLSGSKVNYQDESTGYMVVSGQSRGYGLELRPDGSFLQTTVVTSGRPSYRIFVSTTGNWTTNNNQLIFYPKDRHYRKWENEMITTDEHSVPERYTMFWNKKINDITGKECLYVKYDIGQPQWDELCKE